MRVNEAIRARRTIHAYRPEAIDADAVDRAIRAGMWAPNHKLSWPWRFTKVGPKTRAPLNDLAVRVKCASRQPTPEIEAKIRAKVGNPAALLVVTQIQQTDSFREREDYACVAAAIQNLTLSLAAESIGSKWSTGALTRHPETYELLGIDSNAETIVGFIWIGVPAQTPDPPARPPFHEVVRELP